MSLFRSILLPFSLFLVWTTFAFLDLRSSDGNTALLKKGTSVLYETYKSIPIHCGAIPKIESCLDGALNSSNEISVLFGNSQLHAVNDISENSRLIALRLFLSAKDENEYIFTVSYGNANFEEFSWSLQQILSRSSLKRIYISGVFDDMREVGLRPDMLKNDEEIVPKKNKDSNINFLPEIDMQDISESAIEKFFTDTPAWNTRHELKYRINVNLRSIRNKFFGITPETKRKVLPYAYLRNLKFYEEILQSALDNNIEAIVYIAPLLPDDEIPYIREEYSKYKKDMKNIALKYKAKFLNFESIVPYEAWGLKQNTQLSNSLEKDYMHFTEKGHEILSNELIKETFGDN